MSSRAPALFLSHGPGPLWLLDDQDLSDRGVFGKGNGKSSACAQGLVNLVKANNLPTPKALVVISAHYEEREHTVMNGKNPGLLYDYSGFPDKSYQVKWPAPGEPSVASRIQHLLQSANIMCKMDNKRGFDHGVFVPLSLVYSKAEIPVVQVSLKRNASFEDHCRLGEALAPLRDEHIMLIGSGQTTHNLAALSAGTPDWVEPYMQWFNDTYTNQEYTAQQRRTLILETQKRKEFATSHPTTDHYLPLVVIAAASGYTHGSIMFEKLIMTSLVVSHLRFD